MPSEPAGPRVHLDDELVELIEGGASMLVGSVDAKLRPECARALGVEVGPDRSTLTVYLNAALAETTRANLETNPRIALGFSRIHDHRSIQLKGTVRSIRPTNPRDQEIQARYRVAFAEQLTQAGVPRSVTLRLALVPSLALEVELHELFDQTPGVGAGRRLGGDP